MKYTIIVTIYNKENYLLRCLESVCNQSYKDYQVLVIDDGSTDNSQKIIKDALGKWQFKYVYKKNSGIADTRNYAISLVETPYFTFVDGDDFIDHDLLKEAEKYHDYDILSFGAKKLNSKLKLIEKIDNITFCGSGEVYLREIILYDTLFSVPWGYIYNTAFFKENNFKYPYGKIMEDFYLTPFILEAAQKVISIKYAGYYYVMTDDSITNNQKNYQLITQTYLEFVPKIIQELKENDYEDLTKFLHENFVKGTLKSFYCELPKDMRKNYKIELAKLGITIDYTSQIKIFIKKFGLEKFCKKIAVFWLRQKHKWQKKNNTRIEVKKRNNNYGIFGYQSPYEDGYLSYILYCKIRPFFQKIGVYQAGSTLYQKCFKKILTKLMAYQKKRIFVKQASHKEFYNQNFAYWGDKHFNEQLAFVLKDTNPVFCECLEDISQERFLIITGQRNRNLQKQLKKLNFVKNVNYANIKRVYDWMKCANFYYNYEFSKNNKKYRNKAHHNLLIIKHLKNIKLLPSEMFIKAVYSKPSKVNLNKQGCLINWSGDMWLNGANEVPLGNVNNENYKTYDNFWTRIIQLSFLNHNYCFSKQKAYSHNQVKLFQYPTNNYEMTSYPEKLIIALDYPKHLKDEKQKVIKNIKRLKLGETNQAAAQEIVGIVNGSHLEENDFKIFAEHNNVTIEVVINEVYSEKYFDNLWLTLNKFKQRYGNKNEWKINYLFPVFKTNYREIKNFITLVKKYPIDKIKFTDTNNWKIFNKKEYKQKSVVINNQYLIYDFYCFLKDPILKDPIVDLSAFNIYYKNSLKKYRRKD